MLTTKQVAERATGCGGSETAAIMGLHPFMTPFEVWANKVEFEKTKVEAELDKRVEIVHFGNLMEDVIANEYARRTGRKIRKENKTLKLKGHPYILGHIDRRILNEKRALECKNVNSWSHRLGWGEEGTDDVPDYYHIQCQQYNLLMDAPVTDLAACIGGNQLQIYYIEANKELQELMIESVHDFWHQFVLKGEPPPLTAQTDIDTFFAKHDGATVQADENLIAWCETLRGLKASEKIVEREIEAAKKAITLGMGEGANIRPEEDGKSKILLITEAGDPIATWNPQTRKGVSMPQMKLADPEGYQALEKDYGTSNTYRVLLMKKPKEVKE